MHKHKIYNKSIDYIFYIFKLHSILEEKDYLRNC